MSRVVRWGCMIFVAFALAAVVHGGGRASEVPPVIVGVREAVRDAERALSEDRTLRDSRKVPSRVELVCEGGPLLTEDDVELADRLEVERHLAACSRASRRSDPWMVLRVIELERELGVRVPGLVSAAVCWETGYTHGARGDWRDGQARSWGPLQMMGWWRSWCGWRPGARDDVEAAVRCYVARMHHYVDGWAGDCDEPWIVAEAMAANGVRYERWGCRARSKHAVELGAW